MNYITNVTPNYFKANNPKKPQKDKLFRVSYYLLSEVDENKRVPLRIKEFMVGKAQEAKEEFEKVIKDRVQIVRVYKATGLPPLGKIQRHIYADPSVNFLSKNRYLSPRECPDCGKILPRYSHYCPDNADGTPGCARKRHNRSQQERKKQRLAKGMAKGIILCSACAFYPAVKNKRKCTRCYGYNIQHNKELKESGIRIIKRLEKNLPLAIIFLLKSKIERCHNWKTYTGARLPECRCRLCLVKWLNNQITHYVKLTHAR